MPDSSVGIVSSPQRGGAARHAKKASRPGAAQEAVQTALPPFWTEAGLVGLGCLLTIVGLLWIFPPAGIWPLAYVCLVPWTVAICAARRAWMAHWASFIAGWVFFAVGLRWLYPVTELGFVALACYLALYWPLAGWAIRTGRRHGISPLWTLPLAWVATEYMRAWVMSGFPWLFLAHSQYEQLALIQISDLAGAYGVSFVLAMVNGLVAEGALRMLRSHPAGFRQLTAGVIATIALLAATVGYGFWQLSRNSLTPGPRVAVIQEDFPLTNSGPTAPDRMVFASYMKRGALAAQERPDLIVFPETAWNAPQNMDFLTHEFTAVDDLRVDTWILGKVYHQATAALARGDHAGLNAELSELERLYRSNPRLPRVPTESGPAAPVLVGTLAIELLPQNDYPKKRLYNAALYYDESGTQRARYDKHHLVPFGELVPFRGGRLHWLYRWLNSLSPFSRGGKIEYSLTPGSQFTLFSARHGERTYTFGTPICYEDVMPYVVRDYVWKDGQRQTDFLVSMSNDGWFRPQPAEYYRALPGMTGQLARRAPDWLLKNFFCANELPQHLSICVFRAVENRVGIARAVNTGYSGFVDSNGRVYSLVEERGVHVGAAGYSVDHVLLDQRASLYGVTGDWLAALCLILTCILWANAVFARWVASLRARLQALTGRWRTAE